MKPIAEDHIESLAIEQLQSLGWDYVHGLAIAPGARLSLSHVKSESIPINICC